MRLPYFAFSLLTFCLATPGCSDEPHAGDVSFVEDGEPVALRVPTDPVPPDVPPPLVDVEGPGMVLVGMSATEDRLLYLTDPREMANKPHSAVPTMWRLWSMNLDTGAATLVNDRVVQVVGNDDAIVWSDDGRTIAYGRLDEAFDDPDYPDRWKAHIYASIQVWEEGAGVTHSLGLTDTRPMLARSGRRVVVRLQETYDLVVINLVSPEAEPVTHSDTTTYLWHRPTDTLFRQTDAGDITIQRGTDEPLRPLSGGSRLLGLERDHALMTAGNGDLLAYSCKDEKFSLSVQDLELPHGASRSVFFDEDADQGRAVVGLGAGVYGQLYTWDADGGFEHVAMPEPRHAGGSKAATAARMHPWGITYEAHSGWLDTDLWDLRDGVHSLIAENVCHQRHLRDSDLQLIVSAEAGCSASGRIHDVWLYDEATMTLTDSGIEDLLYLRGILSDGRVVYDREISGGRQTMLWDTETGSVEPLATATRFGLAIVRDGRWMVGTYDVTGDDGVERGAVVIVHPGGVTHQQFDGALGTVIVGEQVVVTMVETEPGSGEWELNVEGLDTWAEPRR